MQNTLLSDLIASLPKPEIREVTNFLASPFFNQREDLRRLFDILTKETEAPGKEAVWEQLFPGTPYDDQQLRLLSSYLFKLLEQYLVLKENQNGPLVQSHLLLAAYRRRKLPRHFEKAQRAAQKQLEKQALRHAGFHLESHRQEHEQYLHLLGSGRTMELNLQAVETELTIAMISMKLRQACFLRAHQAVFNTAYQIDLLDEMLALSEQPPYRDAPAVSVYRHCFRALFGGQDERDFAGFKAQLFEHGEHFPQEEMASLYLLALNFCIKKINAGDQRYQRETLDLYREGLRTKLLLEEGKISHFAYNNITGIALRLPGEWKWAEWFVSAYRDYLDPSHREAAFSLNSARLAYVRRRYDEALQYLQRADYKDLINGMVAKVLQLKIYFETSEFDLLDAHLKTMRMFIRRNKRMGYHHRNWQNIVRFTQKLVELNPFDQTQRESLRQAIEGEEVLTEREWLLGQLREV
jgi:hypothetical protein